MAEPNDITLNDLSKSFKEFNEKMGAFSSILEKFGLDIITKMGQTNLKITKLTDKINELDKATIDIKSLIPQLSNVIENQKTLENDLDLIKSLITNITVSVSKKKDIIERNESATDKKESIITQSLTDLFDAKSPSPKSIEKYLEEKIEFWINKLMVKN